MAARRVVITGIAAMLARRLAQALHADPAIEHVAGLDPPEADGGVSARRFADLADVEVVTAALTDPATARLLREQHIDTVVHLTPTGPAAAVSGQRDVDGAVALLTACQDEQAVRKVVLASSTAVYASGPGAPALFTETDTPSQPPAGGAARDALAVEGRARALARQRRDVTLTVLRLATLVGAHADSAFANLFTLPVIPTVMGYDPRLQLLHDDDAVAVLHRAVVDDHATVVNVAGPGALYLSQCIRLAGKVAAPVPLPLVTAAVAALTRSGRIDVTPEQLDFLRFGRVADLRRLQADFGYRPAWSTRAAFDDLVARRGLAGVADVTELLRLQRDLAEVVRSLTASAAR